ncbi:hypothetical protein CO053_01790 [Candidatus Shapirobacteria bacterium CG_4_9_14_0_2_um_filter_40_11]|uniref:Uncharacterized protein n=1 Tax=Candidatus Shapirobacteria bacterium CG_4_9_14_0_2_um_filter_40_11 TaxID=1974876 RepID=A0A2M8EV27_9BACT|nr:MAG: hypothetical protein CO053_01790 [Candidatus Shapirobacteria bacterium CG_4_9_14_0_2_um_filter_40_11]
MSLTNFWREKFWKRASFTDYILVKLSCTAFGVMVAVLIPSLIEINVWWIIAVVILLAIKPLSTVFKK